MMEWKYYNHLVLPTTAPHEEVNLTPIYDRLIWKMNGKPLLARSISNFDCGYRFNEIDLKVFILSLHDFLSKG